MFKRVAICGAAGQLGIELSRVFAAAGCQLLRLVRAELDLTNASLVEQRLSAFVPDLVINSAAYNMVDVAEREPLAAYQVNALAVRNLAVVCRQLDAQLVHFSTDYVFDGAKGSPYVEEDATHPLGAYAVSKLAGEIYAQAYLDSPLIIRT
jgi:dTDP-4-dehydrorhamnose reductase